MSALLDIGVNLLHRQFDADREDVLARAAAAGVGELMVTGTNLADSRRAMEFCAGRSSLWCTAGIHPHDAKDAPADWRERLAALLAAPDVRAVGETGLDFNRNYSPPDVQRSVFRDHLALAAEHGKPAFVHDRDSDGEVFRALAEFAPRLAGVVVHCFTGTGEDLERYLDAGFYIGITGWVCDRRRGGPLRALVPRIPLTRLLVETDAPFLRPHNAPTDHPVPGAGKRNEPALLPYVVDQLAELYGRPPSDIAAATRANGRSLFRLGPPTGGDGA